MVGLVGGDGAFVAVGHLRHRLESAGVPVHVCDVASGEWLELLVVVSSSPEPVTVIVCSIRLEIGRWTGDILGSGSRPHSGDVCRVGRWEV